MTVRNNHHHHTTTTDRRRRIRHHKFQHRKDQCLGKRDKSSAGRLDAGVVEICGILNQQFAYLYTTSSCAGRCFLYTGDGYKATESFRRTRVSHGPIQSAERYFDLTTLVSDVTGGGDEVAEFDGGRRQRQQQNEKEEQQQQEEDEGGPDTVANDDDDANDSTSPAIWLRFEPFILHVACRSLTAASALMAAARPTFKNVGLTTLASSSSSTITETDINDDNNNQNSQNQQSSGKYLVAIWGDEGLDMPLTDAHGKSMGFDPLWLASLVNERHARNQQKIARFVQAVRTTLPATDETEEQEEDSLKDDDGASTQKVPRSYDVVGDVALLHSIPTTTDPDQQREIGNAIMAKNKHIKVVALRTSTLSGTDRSPGHDGIRIIAGATNRIPLMTTHKEYGISAVVNLTETFFSPRMGPERVRMCQQTARGEHVLVLFAGVCLDALQLVARTEAASVTAVECNAMAVACAHKSHNMLRRNVKGVQCAGAAERLTIVQGDVLEVLPTLPRMYYQRIVAPRPKEGTLDGDQPNSGDDSTVMHNSSSSSGGADFLALLLPVLADRGECHWYDFCADHEFPQCQRTRDFVVSVCSNHGLAVEILHVAHVGSVAKRQLRVCLDFRVTRKHRVDRCH